MDPPESTASNVEEAADTGGPDGGRVPLPEGTQEAKSGQEASKVTVMPSTSSAPVKMRDDVQEAQEKRRIWSMAAASAAEMIKEFAEKPIPDFEDVTKVFIPITPAEWARKREALKALRELDFDEQDIDEITDAQIADELFYDPDANDDDLGAFLGQSDQDLKNKFPGPKVKAKRSHVGATQRSKSIVTKPTLNAEMLEIPEEKTQRKSSVKASEHRGSKEQKERLSATNAQSVNLDEQVESSEHSHSQSHHTQSQSTGESTSQSGGTSSRQALNEDMGKGESLRDVNKGMSFSQNDSADDFFYVYEDTAEKSEAEVLDENTEDSEMELYFPADVNINVDEALVGLEVLLDDLKVESRITDRFKYKIINKYSLLLQALITYQERETEVITHLQTKKKILHALHEFVKADAIHSATARVPEEEKEEEKEEGQGIDMSGALDSIENKDPEDKQKPKENQGLSIEEMSAGVIRDTLLTQKNRLDVLESIKKIHVLQMKQLEFERTLLNLHYSRMVKPSDLSKEIKDGRRQVNDLQLEISSLHQEMGQVQNEIRIQDKQVVEEEKSVEKLELEALTKQGEVQVLANKPVHIAKEADREAQKLEQFQDTHDNLCTTYMETMEEYRKIQTKVDTLQTELSSLTRMEIKLAHQKKVANREYDQLLAQMDNLMSREHVMLDKATVLTERMQHLIRQKKKMMEEHHRMFNDANKSLREAQRLERSIKLASDAYLNAKLAYDKMRIAFDAVKPNDQNSNWEKLARMLQKEIINLKGVLSKQLDEANYKSGMVAKLQTKLNELYESQVAAGKELQELIRHTVRKRREREEKSEQCIKLEAQIQRILLVKKSREVAINDCLRSEKIIFKHLSRMQKKFNILKLEKSLIINELTASRQQLSELKAKSEDLDHKLTAYLEQIQVFEGMIKEKYYITLNARIKRDSIKNDAMRSRQKFRFYRNQKLELLLNNKTLRREADKQRVESTVIRKEFEKATNAADEFAIGYRIRMEEICTFQEYIYCYRKILLQGSEEITIREMEKSKLSSVLEESRKHVFIVQMNQPDETVYFKKIEKLRYEFYKITDKRRKLEVKLNEDENPARVREIDYNKMKEKENVEVLQNKLELREEGLAVKDVIGLERTLIENHLTKISEDCLHQALFLKDFYGVHVKAIVGIRRSLNNLTRQMEGFMAETAIATAQAKTAENHYNDSMEILEEAEERLSQGLPPTDDMEQEWIRRKWRGAMLKKAGQKQSGFLRKVKHTSGTQVQAKKWTSKKRQLEDPNSSRLGWHFTAITTPMLSTSSSMQCRFGVSNEKK